MSAPFFSIVIPTYNRSDLVGFAVQSVLAQTFTDLEVVVSDNCSTDDTAEVVQGFTDVRVRYARTPAHGPIADSWEFARLQARGRMLMMLSDDDALVPEALERFAEEARRHDADLLFCAAAEYRDTRFPGPRRNTLSCPPHTGVSRPVAADEFLRPLFAFRHVFEMHPSAFVFGRGIADTIATRCGRFFQTNGVEYCAWPMAAAIARALVYIDAPLVVLGRTAKSWGSNLRLANPGKEKIAQFIADVEKEYRYAPLTNFTIANMWAEGVLTAKKLLPRELEGYDLDEAAYLSATARELRRRRRLGVDVSRDLAELEEYVRQSAVLSSRLGAVAAPEGRRRSPLALALAAAGYMRRRLRAYRRTRAVRRGDGRSGFRVSGRSFGFQNVLESSQFLARVAPSRARS